nr:PEP-CTERM sorting domain-containing protein [Duganella margarita]
MFKKFAAVVCSVLLSMSGSMAHANDYKVNFSISGFGATQSGIGQAPFKTAFGSVIFSAASPSSDWDTLKAFSLTIGDVSYSMSDVAFANHANYTNVGGLSDENHLDTGTNDFAFSVFHDDETATLTYSSLVAPGFWSSGYRPLTITQVGVVSQVPEPETYAMLLAGIGLLGGATLRRRKLKR